MQRGVHFASVLMDHGSVKPEKVKHVDTHIGFDMGITDFITTSEGVKVDNPRFVNKSVA